LGIAILAAQRACATLTIDHICYGGSTFFQVGNYFGLEPRRHTLVVVCNPDCLITRRRFLVKIEHPSSAILVAAIVSPINRNWSDPGCASAATLNAISRYVFRKMPDQNRPEE
jgi:hypothetical protein